MLRIPSTKLKSFGTRGTTVQVSMGFSSDCQDAATELIYLLLLLFVPPLRKATWLLSMKPPILSGRCGRNSRKNTRRSKNLIDFIQLTDVLSIKKYHRATRKTKQTSGVGSLVKQGPPKKSTLYKSISFQKPKLSILLAVSMTVICHLKQRSIWVLVQTWFRKKSSKKTTGGCGNHPAKAVDFDP